MPSWPLLGWALPLPFTEWRWEKSCSKDFVLYRRCHSTDAPYLYLIRLPPTVYDLSNWELRQINISLAQSLTRSCFEKHFCIRTGLDWVCIYSTSPLIRINWDGEPSGCEENPDNWIFLWKWVALAVCSSAVTIYSMYLRLNLSTTSDLKF